MRAETRAARVLCGEGSLYSLPPPTEAADGERSVAAAIDASRRSEGFLPEVEDPVSREVVVEAFAALRTSAGARLAEIGRGDGRVAVFGDYDVDGVASTVSLAASICAARIGEAETLSLWDSDGLGAACFMAGVEAGVPERREGYGLSAVAVSRRAAEGCADLVCVDNGTNALSALALAERLGVRVLVLDHHPPSDEALAYWCDPRRSAGHVLLNPWCEGPLADLASGWRCGRNLCATVVVEAAVAEAEARSGGFRPWSTLSLRRAALGAVATIADMMPLLGANRGLVRQGLAAIDAGHGPSGLIALRDSVFAAKSIGPSDGVLSWEGCAFDGALAGFQVAPRINACGRMGRAALALAAMSSSVKAAGALGEEVEALNGERRAVQADSVEDASGSVAEALGSAPPFQLVVAALDAASGSLTAGPLSRLCGISGSSDGRIAFSIAIPGLLALFCASDMSEGMAGLVAGRISERFRCPAIALSGPHGEGGILVGSGRVPPGSPFRSLGSATSRAIVAAFGLHGGSGGGHAAAFGVRIRAPSAPRERFDAVRKAFVESALRLLRVLGAAIAEGAVVREAVSAESPDEVDVSASSSSGARVAEACSGLGPFGGALAEPLMHCPIGRASLRPIGAKGTMVVEPPGSLRGDLRIVAFPSVFEGVDVGALAAMVAGGRCSVVGLPRRSFYGKGRYGRGGDRWAGAALEIDVRAVVEEFP